MKKTTGKEFVPSMQKGKPRYSDSNQTDEKYDVPDEVIAHSKKTVEIQDSVERHFRIGGRFAVSRPVSGFGLINDGIKYFSQ
jgi:hypothetical protein